RQKRGKHGAAVFRYGRAHATCWLADNEALRVDGICAGSLGEPQPGSSLLKRVAPPGLRFAPPGYAARITRAFGARKKSLKKSLYVDSRPKFPLRLPQGLLARLYKGLAQEHCSCYVLVPRV